MAADLPQENATYRYRLRAKDTQDLLSSNSEECLLVLGAPIGKRAVGAQEREAGAGESRFALPGDLPAGRYYCVVVMDDVPAVCLPVLVVR